MTTVAAAYLRDVDHLDHVVQETAEGGTTRFDQLAQAEQHQVYYKLWAIQGAPIGIDNAYGEHAFRGTHERTATLGEKIEAIRQYVVDTKWNALSQQEQQRVYYHLWQVHGSPLHLGNNYGADAFHGVHGRTATTSDKLEAMRRGVVEREWAVLPQEARHRVYYHLWQAHGAPTHLGNEYGADAFHGVRERDATSAQKLEAIRRYQGEQSIVGESAYDTVPEQERGHVYRHLWQLHGRPLSNRYGEYAFFGLHGRSSTQAERAESIRRYRDQFNLYDCTFCLNALQVTTRIQGICGHYFHEDERTCPLGGLMQWFYSGHFTCPLDRQLIV